jgi:hypothetical protein
VKNAQGVCTANWVNLLLIDCCVWFAWQVTGLPWGAVGGAGGVLKAAEGAERVAGAAEAAGEAMVAEQGPYWQPCQCARQAQAAVVSRSGSLAEANVGWDTTGWLLNSLCVRDDKVAMVDGDKAACQAQPAPVHPG